jgi:hypothetical protein
VLLSISCRAGHVARRPQYFESVKGGVHSHALCRCNCEVCRGDDDDDGFENCKAHRTMFTGTTALWQAIVCDKMDDDL